MAIIAMAIFCLSLLFYCSITIETALLSLLLFAFALRVAIVVSEMKAHSIVVVSTAVVLSVDGFHFAFAVLFAPAAWRLPAVAAWRHFAVVFLSFLPVVHHAAVAVFSSSPVALHHFVVAF